MKALITANLSESSRERLANELGIDVDYRPINERRDRLPPEELKPLLEDVEVFIVGFEGVSADVMDAAPNLEIIACTRGGPDASIDINAATDRSIPVLYAPGRNAVSVADLTLGLILSVARYISHGHHLLNIGEFTGTPQLDHADGGGEREDVSWGVGKGSPYTELKGPELANKTLGIVGLGAIGRKVANRAAGFDMNMVGFDPFIDAETMAEISVEKVELNDLCRQSDFVSIHCPVTESTRGLIGPEQFDLMDDNTYFINTARGSIIDQDALIAALDADELAGAALDVYDKEPLPSDHPLLGRSNVVTTPHLAGAAKEVVDHHSKMVVDGIASILNGQMPEYIANEDALTSSSTINTE